MAFIRIGNRQIDLGAKTHIMGILNVTPDSFSDGGRYTLLENALEQARRMVGEGADFIDVGGESTRPGSAEVDEVEEMRRVLPVIEALVKEIHVPISIDTYKASVAEAAIKAGASLINDVWGFQKDARMAEVAAAYDVPSILMHNQTGTHYDQDILESMKSFFEKSIGLARKAGYDVGQIILDPGIGFGKTAEQNIEVMSRLEVLHDMMMPVLLGTSRKSMIGHILDLPADERLEGTIATNVIGAVKGASIIRVHDVKAHVRALKVTDAILRR